LEYSSTLNEAARLALSGKSYMREVAETDEDLRRAVDAAERSGDGKHAATAADAGGDEQHREIDDGADRSSDVKTDPDEQQVSRGTDDVRRRTEHKDRERSAEAGPQSGETNRSDPAQQHVPRLEELERKAREEREQDRDRDDFER
jgi:hypothetical protein